MFSEATQFVLARWDLTRTAVAERWGGVKSLDKYNHMISDLMLNLEEQWKDGNDIHEDSLDVYFLECLESYFNVDFENGDDSVVTEVSLIIQDLYRKCAAGELGKTRELVASLDTMPSMRKGGVRPAEDDEDADDEDGEDEEEEEEGEGGEGGEGGETEVMKEEKESGVSRRGTVMGEDGWETVVPKKGGSRRSGVGGGGGGGMD